MALLRSGVLALLLMVINMTSLQAFELQTVKISDNVYALIGGKSLRTYENHALNSTSGFIIGNDGVILIDPGASSVGAALIEQTIHRTTQKPVKWVINSGAQDHRWLGNGYFAAKGAEIIALRRTVESQKQRAGDHMTSLQFILKDRLKGTEPVFAPRPLPGDHEKIERGGVKLEIIWPGHAHFAGDAVIWLPEQNILFTGDLVFLERMLGVLPFSNAASWARALDILHKLKPRILIPGHGGPGSVADAQRDTGAYLNWLIENIRPEAENWTPLEEVEKKFADAPFKFLLNYDLIHKKNVIRTYLQLEAGN